MHRRQRAACEVGLVPKQCPRCQSLYPNFVDFCVSDGLRLRRVGEVVGVERDPLPLSGTEAQVSQTPPVGESRLGRARLIPQQEGVSTDEVIEFFGSVVLGRYEPAAGPVDIDLSDCPGHETIAPRHARLCFGDGRWTVEDLGSETGVFLDGATRITRSTPIEDGQELSIGSARFLFEADQSKEST